MGMPWLVIMRMTVFQPSSVYPDPVRAPMAWQVLHLASTKAFPGCAPSCCAQAERVEQSKADIANALGTLQGLMAAPLP
jgi:hypothetical protein